MDTKIGKTNTNRFGSIMEVIEYNNADDIWVKFEKGNLRHTSWKNFKNGNVRNVFDKSVYWVGYIGEGNYNPIENGKKTKQYQTWQSMLQRCYDEKLHKRSPSYVDCSVSDEWHSFQVFAKWYDENYYEIDDNKMHLDKDILVKRNKIYSPDTCVFVPQNINLLIVNSGSKRGKFPIGVSWSKQNKKFISVCSNNGEGVILGRYDTQEEAFSTYKTNKEKLIKSIANEYIDKIPERLYNALMNYIIEIDD